MACHGKLLPAGLLVSASGADDTAFNLGFFGAETTNACRLTFVEGRSQLQGKFSTERLEAIPERVKAELPVEFPAEMLEAAWVSKELPDAEQEKLRRGCILGFAALIALASATFVAVSIWRSYWLSTVVFWAQGDHTGKTFRRFRRSSRESVDYDRERLPVERPAFFDASAVPLTVFASITCWPSGIIADFPSAVILSPTLSSKLFMPSGFK